MATAEYLELDQEAVWIKESWQPYDHKAPSEAALLEAEIDKLRSLMVELFVREQSLTSEIVVEISCQLDRKINAYMALMRRNR